MVPNTVLPINPLILLVGIDVKNLHFCCFCPGRDTDKHRQNSKMGKITGMMNIDEYGRRRDFNIRLLDSRPDMIKTGFGTSLGCILYETRTNLKIICTNQYRTKYLKLAPERFVISFNALTVNVKITFYTTFIIKFF